MQKSTHEQKVSGRRPFLVGLALAPVGLACSSAATPAPWRDAALYDVRDFGATGDGKSDNSSAIGAAIAAAAERGGGSVYVPPGRYATKPIVLSSNITLIVDAGAELRFSQNFADYLPMVRTRWEGTLVKTFCPMFYAQGAENIAIVGRGVLDGQGEPWWEFQRALEAEQKQHGSVKGDSEWQRAFVAANPGLEMPDDPRRLEAAFLRPPFLQFIDCKNVLIDGVTFKNSPFWTLNPVFCDNVVVSRVTIQNPAEAPNTDGINPDSCRNVHISDCHIDVGDDCITIKSGRDREGRRLARPAENHTITNCTMLRGHGGVVIGSEMSGGVRMIAIANCVFDGTDRGIRIKSTRGRGGVVEDVRVANVVMRDIREQAIVLSLRYSDSEPEPLSERTPRFRDIHLSGITATAREAGELLGLEEAPLEQVTLTDIDVTCQRGLRLENVQGVSLSSLRVQTEAGPGIALRDVAGAFVRGCVAPQGSDVFLRVSGPRSRAISLRANELGAARTAVLVDSDVPAGEVEQHP
jgi:polygalacturonase